MVSSRIIALSFLSRLAQKRNLPETAPDGRKRSIRFGANA